MSPNCSPMLGQENDLFSKNLDIGEECLVVLRRHWIVYLDVLGIAVFLLLYSVFVIALQLWINAIPPSFLVVLLITSWLYFLQIIYIRWLNNQLDVTIVTNKRILDLEQTGFLSRKLSECTLSRVQEINAQKGGLMGNLLHYGDISIHTSADKSDFHICWVHNPIANARKIHSIVDTYRHVGQEMAEKGIEPNMRHDHLK